MKSAPPPRPPQPRSEQRRPPQRSPQRRPPRGLARLLLVGVPLLIFGSMATVAVVGFLAVVGLFLQYSSDPTLPDVHSLQTIVFSQETIVYARDGKTELARFSDGEFREVATFDELPPILLDATTAVEDKTFWTNTGFDPVGIVSASISSLRGDTRGASTITQQLVRQRLLPPELVQDPERKIERKLKEIIQSIRVTEAFAGEAGKQQILTAYLNQNFYGDNAYGVKTAAYNYFGLKDLSKLSLAQAAILAAIPQSPSNYDLARNAVETEVGDPRCPNATQACFIVPDDSPVVGRRNYILDLLADPARRPQSADQYSTQDFLDAQKEPVVIKNGGVGGPLWKAPHFVWYVRSQLAEELCGNQPTCPRLEQGGLHIITTIDPHIQAVAEKWVQASALVPHRADPPAAAAALGVPYTAWMANLHGKNVWNGAASAIDYQTGEILAYVGSANYYESRKVKPQFQPQFDVLSNGWRQPGSAFKPFNYVTGLNDGTLTASSMFMDVTTDFGNGYTPTDADSLERGPVRLRQALQFSLNIPSVKAMAINGVGHVYDTAQAFGLNFETGRGKAGLSSALGSLEVHPLDLTTAYGTMANRGRYVGHTAILAIKDGVTGEDVVPPYVPTPGTAAVSPQSAYVITDILAGNTDPAQNPIWGAMEITTPSGQHRPATLKTGTNNDTKDLSAYGYIAPPTSQGRANGEYALVLGVWNGNSDATPVSTPDDPLHSLDVTAPVWQAIMKEATKGWAVNDFKEPGGIGNAQVDAHTGFKPTVWSQKRISELFIDGTGPADDPYIRGIPVITGPDGKDYRWKDTCPGQPVTKGFLVLGNAEADQSKSWADANAGWVARARKGPGVVGGPENTATSYFYNSTFMPYGRSWGAPFVPVASCDTAPSASPSLSPSPLPSETASPGPSTEPTPTPTPEPTRTPRPSKSPKPTVTPAATDTPAPPDTPAPTPTRTPKPPRTPKPTPPPTPPPADTPEPTDAPQPS